ncbi:MAG TPA: hypothetical protein VGS97_01230 [Actinocrinis sp.]|nr:hypothetical protein [Actinocrinis sp.]HEV2342689.1 hypothetical protein [Actinocrinis sp.]
MYSFGEQVGADVAGVGRRDGFAQVVAGGPGHLHDLPGQVRAGEVADDVHELARPHGSAHPGDGRGVGRVLERGQGEAAGLEQAVAVGAQPEHGVAQRDRVAQFRCGAGDVLDHVGGAGRYRGVGGCDQVGVFPAPDALGVA